MGTFVRLRSTFTPSDRNHGKRSRPMALLKTATESLLFLTVNGSPVSFAAPVELPLLDSATYPEI